MGFEYHYGTYTASDSCRLVSVHLRQLAEHECEKKKRRNVISIEHGSRRQSSEAKHKSNLETDLIGDLCTDVMHRISLLYVYFDFDLDS